MNSIPTGLITVDGKKSTLKILYTDEKQREKRFDELLKLIKMFPDEKWDYQ